MLTTYALEEFLQLNLTVKQYESTGQTSGLPVFELWCHRSPWPVVRQASPEVRLK
jgi:hypothetical protein